MSLVQNVTHVPVHSPLRKAWFPCWARSAGNASVVAFASRVGVEGKNEGVTKLVDLLSGAIDDEKPPYQDLLRSVAECRPRRA